MVKCWVKNKIVDHAVRKNDKIKFVQYKEMAKYIGIYSYIYTLQHVNTFYIYKLKWTLKCDNIKNMFTTLLYKSYSP